MRSVIERFPVSISEGSWQSTLHKYATVASDKCHTNTVID